ncbi:MAG TPA: zinc-binding dehydrogenase [Solirubrobacteraceae bacterium]|jgi:NADPH2:quinone reductase|nr:zinc-binding dehydrogenase [Solirubrobacteraceae bacterium]
MRAVLLAERGAPQMLVPVELDAPAREAGEVLIDVRAAAVNFSDVLIRRGSYARPPSLPAILGSEIAGVVREGDEEGAFEPGERVIALAIGGGGYAEQTAVPREWVFPLDDEHSFEQGAALAMSYATALLCLRALLRRSPGETLLVHGGAGGVGSAAIQLARHDGLRVIATAGSRERARHAREHGAERAVDRSSEDFVAAVLDWTAGAGVHAVLDPLGGRVLGRSLELVRPIGAVAVVGEADGPWPAVSIARLAGRNIGLHGFYLGRLARREPETLRDALTALGRLWREHAIDPHVGSVFALERAGEAHALIERREQIGKVVLKP